MTVSPGFMLFLAQRSHQRWLADRAAERNRELVRSGYGQFWYAGVPL